MKKKFIFTVLVMLAFGLFIGCANTEGELVTPIEYAIYNSSKYNVSIRVYEAQEDWSDDNGWQAVTDHYVQILTDEPIFIKSGNRSTFVVDVSSCAKYAYIGIEMTWMDPDGHYIGKGSGYYNRINNVLSNNDGKIIITIGKNA